MREGNSSSGCFRHIYVISNVMQRVHPATIGSLRFKQTPMEKLLLRMTEVAELLGVSRSTAYAMASAGELPGVVRIRGGIRVSNEVLKDWLARQQKDEGNNGGL
jgi:excisionase family DNA binding protein